MTRVLRGLCVVLLAVTFLVPVGCSKKEQSTASLYAIPANKIEGKFYVDRGQGYRFPLPPASWEYTEGGSVELMFHSRDYAGMIIIDTYVDYLGMPSMEKVARRMADKLRAKEFTLEAPPEMTGGETPYVGSGDMRVSEEGRRIRASIEMKPRKYNTFRVDRLMEVFAVRRRRRIYVVTYVTPADDFEVNERQFHQIIENMEFPPRRGGTETASQS